MNQSYQIEITQTLQRIVTLESDSLENAIIEIRRQFNHEEIVLDDNDYLDTEIKVYSSHEQMETKSLTRLLTSSDLKAIETLLDYVIESEQTSYEECISDNPDINHIYAIAQRIKETLFL
jgi:transcriptional regulator of aromatic amino acid metabolism